MRLADPVSPSAEVVLFVYAMRDRMVGFLNPTFESSDAIALRSFKFAVEQTPFLFSNASDYDLYKIGVFHPVSGQIDQITPPQFLAHATDFAVKE